MKSKKVAKPIKKSPKKRILYAQSGGVTAVINASACGVIQTAKKHGLEVYAGHNGILLS